MALIGEARTESLATTCEESLHAVTGYHSRQKVVLHCSYVYHGNRRCGYDEGNINGEIFTNFIARSLVPLLQPFDGKSSRSVVVMDNASIHHVDQVASLIQSTGAILHHTVQTIIH